jgi:exosome complex component RRP42
MSLRLIYRRNFIPHLHLTLLANSGNVLTALVLAARAAFQHLRIPKTKVISSGEAEHADDQKDLSGIKAAVRAGRVGARGKGKVNDGMEWELDAEGDGTKQMDGKDGLPVLVTLNLVSHRIRNKGMEV